MTQEITDLDAVPDVLTDRDQWLQWDSANDTPRRPHKQGDFTVPWSDPEAWLSHTDAVQGALDRNTWGIGYVTAVNNDAHPMGMVSVIDLDNAVTADGDLAAWVPDLTPLVEHDCYIEWSPSHHEAGPSGLHIPVLGTDIPGWWSDSQIDDHTGADLLANKFCTVTGDRYEGAGDELPTWDDWLVDWLADLYENLNGDDPRDRAQKASTSSGSSSNYDGDGEWLDEETVEEALQHIDPNCEYSQWRDVGFALGDHFSDHTARRLFDNWSRGSSKYDDDAEKYIEDITSREGSGVTIGTVVHLAQEGGWKPDPPQSKSRARTPRELVAEHSDEFDSVEEVPEDIFATDGTADEQAATDGGAAAADATADDDTDSPDEPSVESGWRYIRNALREADDADERREPRFEAAMKLLDDHDFATLRENDQLYVYDGNNGIYNDDGEAVVRSELTEGLEAQYSAHTMSEAHDHIRGRTLVSEDEMGGPEGLIAAGNCVIDLNEQTSREHSPEYHFLSRLGCEFNPDATAPRFKAFLNEVVPSDTERQKLQEYAGYTLMHWGLPYHKALFLVGPTASGKSTFLDTINAMLGEDTVASLTPQQLTGERFAGAELYGKWANIRNDIPAATVKNTGEFKEIIGGDPMKAERKRKDPFRFEPTAKHLYAANELPATETDDEAFYRRILLVPFPETIPVAERDKHLDDKLQSELPGVLNWAIEGLQRLMANGGFTGDRSPGRTQDTWQKWSDSVSRFKDAAINDDGDEEIPKSKLYAAYIEYCRQEGIPSDTQHSLTRGLKQEGLADGRAYVDGDRVRVFHNISLTGRGTELIQDAQSDGGDKDDSTASQRRDRGLSDWD
jgi:putative DNA primase/helicase